MTHRDCCTIIRSHVIVTLTILALCSSTCLHLAYVFPSSSFRASRRVYAQFCLFFTQHSIVVNLMYQKITSETCVFSCSYKYIVTEFGSTGNDIFPSFGNIYAKCKITFWCDKLTLKKMVYIGSNLTISSSSLLFGFGTLIE